jgi:hypothetical protein
LRSELTAQRGICYSQVSHKNRDVARVRHLEILFGVEKARATATATARAKAGRGICYSHLSHKNNCVAKVGHPEIVSDEAGRTRDLLLPP